MTQVSDLESRISRLLTRRFYAAIAVSYSYAGRFGHHGPTRESHESTQAVEIPCPGGRRVAYQAEMRLDMWRGWRNVEEPWSCPKF